MRVVTIVLPVSLITLLMMVPGCLDTDEGPYTFSVYVSNQNEYVDPVHIEVHIDGELLIDDEFENEIDGIKDHNWTRFDFRFDAGVHDIRATTGLNDTVEGGFELEDDSHALITYYGPGADFPGLSFRFLGSDAPSFM